MPLPALGKLVSILFGAGLTVTVAYLLGRLCQRIFRERLSGLAATEARLFAFAAGAACLSNLVFLLAATRLVYDAALLLLAALIAAAWWRWRGPAQTGLSVPRLPSPHALQAQQDGQIVWKTLLLLAAVFYGALYLAHALAPETRSDGVGYHLGLVRRYQNEHGFVPIYTSFYASLTQGAEMLYLFAYSFGRGSAAKLIHLSFFMALLAAMLSFAKRHGAWRAGAAAVVLFACSPIVVPDATSTYNDCALAFYEFMVFYGLVLWWRDRESISLSTLGILAGFCFALKYTGGVALAAVVPLVCWKSARDSSEWRAPLRSVTVTLAAAAFLIAPWLIKNTLFVGNPVAPFFNEVFPNPHFTLSWENGYRNYFRSYSHSPEGYPWYTYPLELTTRGARLGGLAGPIFLLTPLALFAWRKPAGKALLAVAAVSFLPWFGNAGTRFLIPTLVFVSLALGLALLSLPPRWAAVVGCAALLAHAVGSWPAILPRWAGGVWSVVGVPWKAALRIQPEREYLLTNVPYYHVAEVIAAEAAPPGRVFSLEPLPEAYFDAELLVSYQGGINEELVNLLQTAVEQNLWPSRQRRLSWEPRALSGFRIVQVNDHDSHWRMSEIRFLTEQGPLPAGPNWQISSEPRPWHAGRLLDGDPLTSWNSWESLRKGMWIEVRFPDSLTLSGAELLYPWGQHFVEFEYFGLDDAGEWQPLDVRSGQSRLPFDPGGLKKWAVRQLAAHRIQLLVTNLAGGGHNYLAPLIDEDPPAWGLQEIARDGPVRVYRLKQSVNGGEINPR
jgi:4-amino-4-deoxy-L-arabinose transferase-like glycosyltransferase